MSVRSSRLDLCLRVQWSHFKRYMLVRLCYKGSRAKSGRVSKSRSFINIINCVQGVRRGIQEKRVEEVSIVLPNEEKKNMSLIDDENDTEKKKDYK